MSTDETDGEVRDEVRSYTRRFLSLGLQCLSIIIWGAVQVALTLVHSALPSDVLVQGTYVLCLIAEALVTLLWTGGNAWREVHLYFIGIRTDVRIAEITARHRIEDAERRQLTSSERSTE